MPASTFSLPLTGGGTLTFQPDASGCVSIHFPVMIDGETAYFSRTVTPDEVRLMVDLGTQSAVVAENHLRAALPDGCPLGERGGHPALCRARSCTCTRDAWGA